MVDAYKHTVDRMESLVSHMTAPVAYCYIPKRKHLCSDSRLERFLSHISRDMSPAPGRSIVEPFQPVYQV